MDYDPKRTVPVLKQILKVRGVSGHSRKRKDELIEMLRESESLRPTPAHRPTRLAPAPSPAGASRMTPDLFGVRFRPDRPRQPELLRQSEEKQRQPCSQVMDMFEQQEMSKS